MFACARPVLSQHARRLGAAALLFTATACATDVTAPSAPRITKDKNPRRHGKPATGTISTPAFLFVSNASGAPQIYRYRNDSIARLSFSDMPDVNPHVSGSRVVFASYRDGDGEIYVADADLQSARRLTFSAGTDDEPTLSPLADRIAFTSYRTGTSRIFVMDSAGTNAIALETGAASTVPETRPTWSPAGDRIAFASSRTGSSQIFIVDAAGGVARQLTQESIGAFDPVFTPDGTQVIYTAWLTSGRLRVVTLATGAVTDYNAATTQSLGEASCGTDGCVATSNPYGDAGDIVYIGNDGALRTVIARSGNDIRPARIDR